MPLRHILPLALSFAYDELRYFLRHAACLRHYAIRCHTLLFAAIRY